MHSVLRALFSMKPKYFSVGFILLCQACIFIREASLSIWKKNRRAIINHNINQSVVSFQGCKISTPFSNVLVYPFRFPRFFVLFTPTRPLFFLAGTICFCVRANFRVQNYNSTVQYYGTCIQVQSWCQCTQSSKQKVTLSKASANHDKLEPYHQWRRRWNIDW